MHLGNTPLASSAPIGEKRAKSVFSPLGYDDDLSCGDINKIGKPD